jgi:hypothetical protein
MWTRTLLSVVSLIGLAIVSTQASAATPTRFGAKLTPDTQPSNAGNGVYCATSNAHPDCSFVLVQARNCEFGSCINGHLAPKDGTIGTIRLITCGAGSFVLQIVNVKAFADRSKDQAQVLHTGPAINYVADPQHCNGNTFLIQSFPVNVPVKKGNYLGVYAQKVGFMYCSGGGNNTLLFSQPLSDGHGLRTATKGEGCLMLLEAIYK